MIVVWQVTERCNLGCRFCGFDRNLVRSRRHADPQMIRRFGAILADYQRRTGNKVLVSWLGGEPLLWSPLKSLTECFSHDLGLDVSTTTNGTTLASNAVRRHLLDNYAELTISIDAVGSAHDELRGSPGLFESLGRHVRQLLDERREVGRGPLLRANVVLMHQNASAFAELSRTLADWGMDEITFNQLGGNDRPEFYPAHRLQPPDVAVLAENIPVLRSELAARGVRLMGNDGYLQRIAASSHRERLPGRECSPGDEFLFVDITGKAGPCSFTTGAIGVPLEEIGSVEALRQLPARLRTVLATDRPTACDDCLSTYVFRKFAA